MHRIRTLIPNVSREEALDELSSRIPMRAVRDAVFGPVRSVADFYIPFRFFKVEISNRGERQERILGLDAVVGSLDLYEFEDLPEPDDVQYIETRNCAEVLLDDARAAELLKTKVQRLLFTTGFFRMHNLKITCEPIIGEIYIPYWVAFRGHGAQARFAVMDAMRRRVEGARVRQLLRDWLTSIAVRN